MRWRGWWTKTFPSPYVLPCHIWSSVQYYDVTINPTWRTAAILKIVISPYLRRESSKFYEIWYANAYSDQDDENVRTFQNSQIQDGRRTPYWKSFFGYNSAPCCPIKPKFGMRRHNRMHTKVWWWKCQISKIQHGERPPFWKSLNLHISAANRPNLTKSDMQTQILSKATETWQKFRNCQIQDGGRTSYWKSVLAITGLHVRLRRNLEFGVIIARIRRLGDENVKFRKANMADGRHFENRYISISQPRIVQIWRNLVCRRKFWPRRRKRDKNSEISKFKMTDRRRIENRFLAPTQLHIAPGPIKMKFGVRRQNHTHTKQVMWFIIIIITIRFYGLSKQLAFTAQLVAVYEFIQSGLEDLQWWSINNLLR